MYNYIFDLDWTLYSEKDVDDSTNTKYYKSFERKPLLNKLLKSLRNLTSSAVIVSHHHPLRCLRGQCQLVS